MNLSELQELGTRPIRPDAPCGENCRDLPDFEQVQAEIRKLEAPDQPVVNWEMIGKTASSVLTNQSKDLLVASYLTVAAYETDGYPGLLAGLTVLRDLVGTFWETVFPERPRGRSAAFEWLNERGARAIERGGKPMAGEAISQALEIVNALDDQSGSLLDVPPLLGDLRRALEEVASNVPPPVTESAPAPATYSPEPSTYSAPAPVETGPPPLTAVETAEEVDSALEEVARIGDLCAGWLRANDAADPFGYRFVRMLYWRQLRESPPNEDGVTVLPDFDTAAMENIEGLAASGEHAAVLEQTENLFLTAPLWFDLSRHAVQALEAQGKEFQPAADAIVFELAQTLKRVPEVANLKTSGGVPFADDTTKKWIAKRVMAGAAVDLSFDTPASAGARPRGGEGFADAQKEAKKLARGNKLGAALKLLVEGGQKSERLDDRVAWKLEAARLCMTSGRFEIALAQLEALDDELKGARIEDWDPALCAEILRDLLRCRQQVAQSADFAPSELARSRELMGRLCRLDVVSALELNGRE